MREMDKYLSLFKAGQMDRRDFMVKAGAAGLSAASAMTLLSGTAKAANKGGHFKIGMAGGATTDSLDPATVTASMLQVVTFAFRNCLVEVDKRGQAVPELAESWEAKPGAVEWVFKLRKGVEFHNGKTMDADDVIWSLNLHRGENSQSGAKGIVAGIDDIKKVDSHTIAIVLKSGNADLPYVLADYHLQIMPKDSAPDAPIGTGAFTVDSFDPGVRFTAKRNANYWKEGRGHFDSLEILGIEDVAARTSALQTGEVHLINRVDPKTLNLLKRVKGVQILSTSASQHFTMPMLGHIAPYDNNDIRLALKYAVDREQLVKTILRGYGKVGNDHPISESSPFHNGNLAQHSYDPDKAAFHFKKAGLSGAKIELSAAEAAFTGAVDTAVLFQESASKAGITIDVKREPNDGYWSNVWMKKPFCFSYWGGRPTPDLMFSTAYKADASWNESAFKREDFDKILIEARAELDNAKRTEMYHEMQRIVSEEGNVIIPMFADYLAAATDKLENFEHVPTFEFSGFRVTEQAWFKS